MLKAVFFEHLEETSRRGPRDGGGALKRITWTGTGFVTQLPDRPLRLSDYRIGNGIKQTKDDEKVLVYFETHLIPILVDYNKGGADWEKWDSVEISTAIIKYDSFL